MSHKRVILLILGIALLAYVNSLFNGFIGDSKYIFTDNTFYKSLENVPRLFEKGFVMDSRQLVSLLPREISFSGCVSYRPVTAAFFFLDYFLWGQNPFGHHLTNIVLHALTAVAVYFLALTLLQSQPAALLGALIFAVHPLHSEVVNGIGYRSDIISALFICCAFLAWLKARAGVRPLLLSALCCLCFFIALFAKETAVTLPVLILAYELLFRGTREGSLIKRLGLPFLGLTAVLAFYLYVYFIVMPSAFYPKFLSPHLSWHETLLVNCKIFLSYIKVFVFPWTVTVLPTLYAPPATSVSLLDIALVALILLGITVFLVKTFNNSKALFFCMVWFLLNYLPVSNIVPLLNPFAFRFLYLPSVGLMILAGYTCERLITMVSQRTQGSRTPFLLKCFLISVALSATIPHNEHFRNDFAAAGEMIRNYPDSSRPYWILGINYLQKGHKDKAYAYLYQYLKMPVNNAYVLPPGANFAVFHLMGRAREDSPDEAIRLNKIALQLKPDHLLSYIEISKACVLKGDFSQALDYAQKAVELDGSFLYGYVFAVHSLVELGRIDEAGRLLHRAAALAPGDENVVYLENWIKRIENR